MYLYPNPVDFRKSMDDLAALVEPDIKVADTVRFPFLNKPRNRVKILYCERFKISPDLTDVVAHA